MNYLIDTHILIWFIEGNDQLSKKAKVLISDPVNNIYVSQASLWEMTIKISIGKLSLSISLSDLELFIQMLTDVGKLDQGKSHNLIERKAYHIWQKNRSSEEMKKSFLVPLALTLSMVLGLDISALAKVPGSNSPQKTSEEEIKSLAQSDVQDAIPRRTDFVIKLYSNNSQKLSPPDIRKIYDEEFSRQARKKYVRRVKWSVLVSAIVLSFLALAAWSIRKKNLAVVKTVSVTLPFGIGSVDLDIRQVERNVAWSLYIELITRIAIQPLESDQGLLREALTSLYSLFGTTRQILEEGGSVVGVSRESVGGIAIAVLNQGLRPFLAKWHPMLEDWEAQRPSTTSRKQHEKDWGEESQLRNELEKLRQDLEKYAEALADIANVQRGELEKHPTLFSTQWVAVKETARGFQYLERKGRNSVAVFLLRKKKPNLRKYEVLIRQQPLSVDHREINGKLKLFPCPITGGIDGDETPEEATVREVREESGFSVKVVPLGQYFVGTQTNEICYLYYADVTGKTPDVAKQDGSYFESISQNEWHPFEYLKECNYSACQIGYFRLKDILNISELPIDKNGESPHLR